MFTEVRWNVLKSVIMAQIHSIFIFRFRITVFLLTKLLILFFRTLFSTITLSFRHYHYCYFISCCSFCRSNMVWGFGLTDICARLYFDYNHLVRYKKSVLFNLWLIFFNNRVFPLQITINEQRIQMKRYLLIDWKATSQKNIIRLNFLSSSSYFPSNQ